MLSQIDGDIGQFTADEAYDGKPTYQAIVVPPRLMAVDSSDTGPPSQRDKHIVAIAKDGRLKWQAATGYGKRALQSDRACELVLHRGQRRLRRSQRYAGMWTQADIVNPVKVRGASNS